MRGQRCGPGRQTHEEPDQAASAREIAVIDHIDLDKVSAEALVACRPAAVINVAPSISGRYPNLGPEILVAAGIPLLDNVGKGVMERLDEGTRSTSRATCSSAAWSGSATGTSRMR